MQIPNCLTTLSSNVFARVLSSQKIPVPKGSKAQTPQISNSTEKKGRCTGKFFEKWRKLTITY